MIVVRPAHAFAQAACPFGTLRGLARCASTSSRVLLAGASYCLLSLLLASPASAQDGRRIIGPESGTETIAPLSLARESDVLIRNVRIAGDGDGACLVITESRNIEIAGVEFSGCGEFGINASTVDGLHVHDSRFLAAGKGIYVQQATAVRVLSNRFEGEMRNFVQFDKVTGPGNEISYNSGKNAYGSAVPEDLINVFQSHGTEASPIRVIGNDLADGGNSPTGSGIMVGDEGGSHQLVLGNTLERPGQAGIGVAGGKNIRVLWNQIHQDATDWSNVGIYVWNQSPNACAFVQVADNSVRWFNVTGVANPWWDGSNCHPVTLKRNDLNGVR